MATHNIQSKGASLFVADDGDGPTLVFAHCLGLDHHVWDGVIQHMPNHRCVRYDLRGHGQSDAPDGPYGMGTMVADAEAVCDTLDLRDVVFIGLSVGGMVAQGLAVKRLDLVRGMILCATGAKLGQPDPWHARAATARKDGMGALLAGTLDRWAPTGDDTQIAEHTFLGTNPEGYAATCEAIAGTDFYTPTSGLRLPTLGLCGDHDKVTPPDLVRETTDLIPASTFHLIRGAGHVTPMNHAETVAAYIRTFLASIGHL